MNIAKYIDHTCLKADATLKEIEKLCNEAREKGFYSVCVNPTYVSHALGFLSGTDVKICIEAGADYAKTSTGFSNGGATEKAVEIMKKAAQGSEIKIKASGGIKDRKTAERYIELGAERIGTSSGIAILESREAENGSY